MTVRVCSSCPSALVGISRCCFLQRRLRALEAGAGGVVLEALCWWLVVWWFGGLVGRVVVGLLGFPGGSSAWTSWFECVAHVLVSVCV
ncbi:MAG: hypothetical protein ABGY24_18520 [bacterium]